MKFAVIYGCAVPQVIADEVREVARRADAAGCLNSCDRSRAAESILNANGKLSQFQLWDRWRRGVPGYNPANRPGTSTHERRNDGVAFPGPVGMLLRAYKVGQDWDRARVAAVIRAYAELGWTATVTYPSNPNEAQHINVRKKGREFVPFLTVRRGSGPGGRRGHRVGWVRYALNLVHDPDTKKPYLNDHGLTRKQRQTAGENWEHALKKFQRDHHQKEDGIVGKQTYRQLQVSVRHRKKLDRSAKKRKS